MSVYAAATLSSSLPLHLPMNTVFWQARSEHFALARGYSRGDVIHASSTAILTEELYDYCRGALERDLVCLCGRHAELLARCCAWDSPRCRRSRMRSRMKKFNKWWRLSDVRMAHIQTHSLLAILLILFFVLLLPLILSSLY